MRARARVRVRVLRLRRNLHKVLPPPRNLHFEVHMRATKSAHRGSQSAVPATKTAPRGSQSAAPVTKSARRGSQSAVPATKSANEPQVAITAPVTKSELVDDHHHVHSAAPATKTAFRSNTAPIPFTCHEKSTLKHENTRFPSHLSRKVTTMCENARGT